MKEALIIFLKNPVAGKVKTRLAATTGLEKALEIYGCLLQHTFSITRNISVDKFVFYSDFIPEEDTWTFYGYYQVLQEGDDLGHRMYQAFKYLFDKNYTRVVIIGSDCLQLSARLLQEAFSRLIKYDVVIGPATDGGYYLLGTNRLHTFLFREKSWSTDTVLKETLQDCFLHHLNVYQLPELADVDTEKDWIEQKGHLLS